MRDELSLVIAQVLSFPAAISVAMLSDGRAQYGTALAVLAFPIFMIVGALIQVPAFGYLRKHTRAGYLHFAITGLVLGLLPALLLVLAGGGFAAATAADTWFVCSALLFRTLARSSFRVQAGT